MAVIEAERLTKLYGDARGIEGVTFSVEAAEVFGFLGPNGAGKTTTIRTLLDLLHPSGGSARVFGLDSHRDSVAIRTRLGNLPGDFGYGKQATGREAIRLLARLRGIDGLGRAEALAERFRADLDRPLGRLSRGNRQKVGLILAIFHSPELLILDEPTSGLDPLMQEEFLALVAEERERGCTVFLSSHELDEVERVCDRVGIVRNGKLIAVERIHELLGKARRTVTLELAEPGDLADLQALAALLGCAARALVGLRRADLPLGRRRALEGGRELPAGVEGSVRDRRADQRRAVSAGGDAEPDRAARARLPRRARRRRRALGRGRKRPPRRAALGAGLAPARLAAATFAATAIELAVVLIVTVALTGLGSLVSGADLSLAAALAGYANVWPLALVFAGLGIVATGFSLRTSVVTGSVTGVLVTMYVIDLVGRLDPDLSAIRYASVFQYYGNAIEDGIEPLAFAGVTAVAVALAALGAWLFDRRDLAA